MYGLWVFSDFLRLGWVCAFAGGRMIGHICIIFVIGTIHSIGIGIGIIVAQNAVPCLKNLNPTTPAFYDRISQIGARYPSRLLQSREGQAPRPIQRPAWL